MPASVSWVAALLAIARMTMGVIARRRSAADDEELQPRRYLVRVYMSRPDVGYFRRIWMDESAGL